MIVAGGLVRLAAGALLLAIGASSLGACASAVGTTGPSPASAAGASMRLVPRGAPAPAGGPADEAARAEVEARELGEAMRRDPALFEALGPIWMAAPVTDASSVGLATADAPRLNLPSLPPRVDMRADFLPPPDQAGRPICEIMAVCAALDHLARSTPSMAARTHSPQFLWWNYQRLVASRLTPGLAWGPLGTDAARLALLLRPAPYAGSDLAVPGRQGVVSEDLVPFRPEQRSDEPTDDPAVIARAHLGAVADRIARGETLPADGATPRFLAIDLATLRGVLAAGHPVVLGLPCLEPAWRTLSPARDLVPELAAARVTDAKGHAVLLVGYDDDPALPGGGGFRVRNSWGTGWADGGYARISYRYALTYGETPYFLEPLAAPFEARYAPSPPP